MKKKKKDDNFFFVKISKIRNDKDYFILLVVFLISLYGVPIQTIGFHGFNFNDMRIIKSLSIIITISIFLFYVLFCSKNFKGDK